MSGGMPAPRPREEFRRQLRARLMLEARTVLVPRRERAWTLSALLRPAVAFAAVALLLVGGGGVAAATSVAGDPAFALKRAAEELRLDLASDEVQRVQLLAQLADRRLAELQAVAENDAKSPAASQEYADAVARFRTAVAALQQAAPQEQRDLAQGVADAAREKHLAILDDLQERVSQDARPALERAIEVEQRDTPEEAKDPTRTPRPEHGRLPQPTPRPTAHPAERPDQPDPTHPVLTPSPRPSFSADH